MQLVLNEVRDMGPITAADITRNTGLTKTVVRRWLRHLEREGAIEHEDYQRRARVWMTP
jgi:ribosomal protein S25